MGKKKNGATGGERKAARGRGIKWLAMGVVVAFVGGALLLNMFGGPGRSFTVQGGETRPVMHHAGFDRPLVKLGYQAAATHPELFDEVYCYCNCDLPPFNHKSLLSCFTETHGAS